MASNSSSLPIVEPRIDHWFQNSRRTSVSAEIDTDDDFLNTYTFDALGRNLSQVSPLGTVAYEHDAAGRRTKLTYPGTGLFLNYDYLVTGEITKIRENNASSGAGVLATYAYDDLGRRTSLTRGNGTTTSYSHDPVSRLSQLVQNLSGTTHDLTLGFGLNPASPRPASR